MTAQTTATTQTASTTQTTSSRPMASPPEIPRPTFHFTPRRNWMNDPNGLVFSAGEWHLYFQYNPEGSDWGNMSWGHATSRDLARWTEHGVALRYRDGEQIYSGSIVATADDDAPLTAFYTSAYDNDRQAQSMAVSRDGGYSWLPSRDNPVLDRGTSDFRDPKVIRTVGDDGTIRWIMLTVEAVDRQVLIYSSTDLHAWSLQSSFGPIGVAGVVWECPDLVFLPVDGDPDRSRWVLLLSTNSVGDEPDPDGSSMHYVVGQFDGVTFTADEPELARLDHGRDFYAGVTFDSAPGGESIALGWMSNWRYAHVFPSSPWRGAMSLPRRLSLRTVGSAVRLVQEPVDFVRELLSHATPRSVSGAPRPETLTLSGHTLAELSWDPAATGELRIELVGSADAVVEIDHSPLDAELRVTRRGPAAAAVHPDFPSTTVIPGIGTDPVRLVVSLDGPLLEVFVDDGVAAASNLVVLGEGPVGMTVTAERDGRIMVSATDVGSAGIDAGTR